MNRFEELRYQITGKMVEIPCGQYLVGSDDASLSYIKSIEEPIGAMDLTRRLLSNASRIVQSEAFHISSFPITNMEFEVVFPEHVRAGVALHDDHPVVDITHTEILRFCKKLHVRLATENEWEIAARGRANLIASNASAPSRQSCNCWPSNGPTMKGAYSPNDFGVYDMCGNVYEFLGGTYVVANGVSLIPIRGGSWGTCAHAAIAALPAFADPYVRSNRIGFRVAL